MQKVQKSKPITPVLAQEIWERLLKRKSEHTQRAYRTDLESYAGWTKAEHGYAALSDLLALGRVEARAKGEEYQQFLSPRMATATAARRLSTLKAFVTAAWRDGIVDWKLESKVTTNKSVEAKRATQRRDMRGPSPDRLKKIREVIAADKSPAGIRDLAIFALGESPMLRRSEMAALTVEDVNLEEKTVRVFGKKRTASETLNLVDDTIRDLKPWVDLRKGMPSHPLFARIRASKSGGVITNDQLTDSAIYYITRRRSFEAGFKTKKTFVRPHGLRHAGITNIARIIAQEGLDVGEGMAISRHKKGETFRAYIDKHGDSQQRRLMEKATRISR